MAWFASRLSADFKKSRVYKERFCELEAKYLDGALLQHEVRIVRIPSTHTSSNAGPGRPEKAFCALSEKSEKRKVDELLHHGPDKLLHATFVASYAAGDRAGAEALRTAIERRSSSASADSVRSSTSPPPTEGNRRVARKATPEQALGRIFILTRIFQGAAADSPRNPSNSTPFPACPSGG